MKRSIATLVGLALGLASFGLAPGARAERQSDKDCQQPKPPEIPDATQASDVEMIAATQRVKLFIASANEFLDCLDRAQADIGTTSRDLKRRRIEKKRAEMGQELKNTTERFNEQVRVYKGDPKQEKSPELDAKDPADTDAKADGAGVTSSSTAEP